MFTIYLKTVGPQWPIRYIFLLLCISCCCPYRLTCFASLHMKGFVLKLMLFLQYTTYKHIKERFSDRLWLNVVSKCDLLGKTAPINFYCDDNDDELAQYKKFGPEGSIQVSMKGEIGMKEVSDSRRRHPESSKFNRLLFLVPARVNLY
jgi:hypothetical protein